MPPVFHRRDEICRHVGTRGEIPTEAKISCRSSDRSCGQKKEKERKGSRPRQCSQEPQRNVDGNEVATTNLNVKLPMPNQAQNPKKYDLEERTSKFGVDIILFAQSLPQNPINSPLITQLIRAVTSIGANYMEADAAESKKDFQHKIGICKKESKESLHWLRMIAAASQNRKEECRTYWKEAHELLLIFSSIVKKSRE